LSKKANDDFPNQIFTTGRSSTNSRRQIDGIRGTNSFTWPSKPDIILTLEEDIVLEPVTVKPVNSRGNIGLKKKDYKKILAVMVVVFSSNNFISFSFLILKQ
jgi:hypothetical protein